mmetsp:Transcript_10901/g.30598  ORF Transcript_10901/g.30598 Transcript_10901/m.30598 type:complete len:264 (-) Transcript_10901:266-1057(-)
MGLSIHIRNILRFRTIIGQLFVIRKFSGCIFGSSENRNCLVLFLGFFLDFSCELLFGDNNLLCLLRLLVLLMFVLVLLNDIGRSGNLVRRFLSGVDGWWFSIHHGGCGCSGVDVDFLGHCWCGLLRLLFFNAVFRDTSLMILLIKDSYIRCLYRCNGGLISVSILLGIYASQGIILLVHLERRYIGSLGLLFSCRRSLLLLTIRLTKVEHLRKLRVALTLRLGSFPVIVKLGRLTKACLLLIIIVLAVLGIAGIVGHESFDLR